MREIVGANIQGTITNSVDAIKVAVKSNAYIQFLSKAEMQFMSACDLGANWDNMAKSPILFVIDGDNVLQPIQKPFRTKVTKCKPSEK